MSRAVFLDVADNYSWVVAHGVILPFGYNWATTQILFLIPWDYPTTPPGLTTQDGIYLPRGLRYFGRVIRDYHEHITWGNNWCWFCYKRIRWNPYRDDLITILEMVRTDLQNPRY